MKKSFAILLLLIAGIGASGQIIIPKKDYVQKIGTPRFSFTISLVAGSYTSLTSYGIMRQNPDSTKEVLYLTFDAFIRQVTANEKSRANPNKINYLDEFGLEVKDFKNLWKLKHDEYPYDGNNELGYGTTLGAPSKGQYEMLKPYGINKVSDYCYGDNLWKLMLKVKDPAWIGQYQQRK